MYTQNHLDKISTQYQILAKEFNLKMEYVSQKSLGFTIGKRPLLSGNIKGRNIEILCQIVHMQATDAGEMISENIIKTDCNLPKDIKLVIYKQGLGDSLKTFLLGMQDIPFDDKGFDDNFVIQSTRFDFARKVLDAKLRNQLVRDMGILSSFKIESAVQKFQLPKNPFKNNKTDQPEDILDFPIEKAGDTKEEQDHSNTKTINYFKNTVPHNIENDMKRDWLARAIKTNLLLANQIEKASKELSLY